ncbi:DNA polymerase III subunit gamma and tau [Arthrobacter sp. 260]|uniref:DNA polymerase III subunit gamma and tau n=1 Tax=Arthrobacter sp. 260 TaxID=2735314 RepID=UPI001491E5E6|nr:DNA polymerase III subunit gamma and tau [Arthrobacter sp. 260]
MSTALYRRYRPEAFADVIGQEHVTEPLMAAIEKGRVNHAYLFSGPRGCGKTTSARILARCLNCAQGPTPVPCGVCDSCVELARGGSGSLDVIEIDAASHGGVDDARDLRERATFAPVRDRYKIFIIDEAHMVTSAGFNALLKIVEEPPEHIKFIFATTEPDKVIGTIRSRTHHYPFRLVPPEPLMGYLDLLCTQEGIPVAPGVLSLVIRAGGGSVRDSLSVLDQLMAGAGPDGLDYELAVSLLGYTHASLLDDVVDAFAAGDAGTVFSAVDRVIQTGHDPRRFVEDLLERFRDLIIVNAVPDSAAAILRGTPDDQLNRMRTQANQMGRGELSRAADITNTALTEMTGATSPRLHLELLCARILLPAADETERGTLARVDRIERRLQYAGSDAVPAAAPVAPTAPAQGQGRGTGDQATPERGTPEKGVPTQPRSGQFGSAQVAPAAAAPDAGAAPQERIAPPAADAVDAAPAQNTARPVPDDAAWPDESTFTESAPVSAVSAPAGPATPSPETSMPAQAEPAPAPTTAGAPQVEMIRRAWPEIMDELARIKRTTWLNVNPDAKPRTMNGNQLVLAFATQGNAIAFQRGPHMDNVKQAIHKILALDVTIEVVHDGAAAAGEPNPKVPTSRQTPAEPHSSSTPETRRVEPVAATPRPAAVSPDTRSTEPPSVTAPLTSPDASPANPAPVAAATARPGTSPARQAPSATSPATVTPATSEPATVSQVPSAATPATPAAVSPAPVPETVQPTRRPSAASTTAGHAPTTRWNTGPAAAGNQSPAPSPAAHNAPGPRDGSGARGGTRPARTAPQPDDSWASVEPPSDEYDLGPESTAWQTPEPSEAETWAPESPQPAPARTPAAAPQGSAPPRQADPGQRPEATPPAQRPPSASPEAAPSAAKPLSRYQRLLDEAERKRQEEEAANPRKGAVDLTYIEDEPSADDVTIEESGLVGRSAIERILNGRLIEERGVDSP